MQIKPLKSPSKTNPISWILFLTTLSLVTISIIPAIFPALLLRTFGGFADNVGINPFETGIWAGAILITNFILLGLGILYHKNKLPKILIKGFQFILAFEVSSRIAFVTTIILIGIYVIFSVGELFDGYFEDDYYYRLDDSLKAYDITQLNNLGNKAQMTLLTLSEQVFGNYKVIPFIASIALLVTSYVFTTKISHKRFAGIVAMVIVLQSGIFLKYDTAVTYPNFWILFYLLSLYFIYRKISLSSISFLISASSKLLSVTFFPMTLFFIYKSNIPRKNKIYLLISYGIIVVLALIFLLEIGSGLSIGTIHDFNYHDLWGGFGAIVFSLRNDAIVMLFLVPLIFCLFYASKKGIAHADSIMFLMTGIMLTAPLLAAFTSNQNMPYRFIPLIVFFAIGVGILLSKKKIITAGEQLSSKS